MGVVYDANATRLMDLCTRVYFGSSPNFYEYEYPSMGICIHHGATTSMDSMWERFKQRSEQASSHYAVKDKSWTQFVSEKHGAWTCGCDWGNCNLISIECANSSIGGDYPVSDATFDTCARLMADIARRHGWKKLERGYNVWGHRDMVAHGALATACPGNYLYARLDRLCSLATQYIEGGYEDMATKDELKVLPWTYKNDKVNGAKDAYRLLTDATNDSKSNGDKLDRVIEMLDDLNSRVDKLEKNGNAIDAFSNAATIIAEAFNRKM